MTPMVFWKRQLRENSAGAGKFRGGLGQSVEISSREGTPFALFAAYQRQIFPARGSDGGHDGAAGSFWLKGGGELGSRGKQIIPANEHLVIEIPGGGGLGNPAERDPAAVLKDVVSGLVSGEMARDIYKVAITDDLTVDEEGTRALREAG